MKSWLSPWRRGSQIFSPQLEKCVGDRLKLSHIVQKIWAPLRKLFLPPGVPSWLRTWSSHVKIHRMITYVAFEVSLFLTADANSAVFK